MTTIEERFQAAVNVIKGLPKNGPYQPTTAMALKFYGFYKQATEGVCHQKKPAFWDIVGKAKWDAWHNNQHLSKEEAMNKYVESLQEIIETMSFTENVQNFVGSLSGLERINLDELDIIAPGMKELAESHPNSPFNSRKHSPQHQYLPNNTVSNNSGELHSKFSDYNENVMNIADNKENNTLLIPSKESIRTVAPTADVNEQSMTNSNIDQSDEEFVDPFDIQSEISQSLLLQTSMLKRIQNTVEKMDADLNNIQRRVMNLEQTINEIRNILQSSNRSYRKIDAKHRLYLRWWPFVGISPTWFLLLIIWPFFLRQLSKGLRYSKNKRITLK